MSQKTENQTSTNINQKNRSFLTVFLVLTLFGILQAIRLYYVYNGSDYSVPFAKTFVWAMGEWYLWGLLGWLLLTSFEKFKFDSKKKFVQVFVSIVLAPVIVVLHLFLYAFFWYATRLWFDSEIGSSYTGPMDIFYDILFSKSFYGLLTYILIISLYFIYSSYKKIQLEQKQSHELKVRLSEAELEALKTQLQPHFLFNTLNTITSLIHTDPNKADIMTTRLGELLRTTLDSENKQKVLFKKEISFIKSYLDIQQIRFEDRLKVSYNISDKAQTCLFPNLFLQPIVENSIRHGLADKTEEGQIIIEAKLDDDNLIVSVIDNGHGLPKGFDIEKLAQIGISNCRMRLKQLYGSKGQISFVNLPESGLKVTITIPVEYDHD